MLKNLESAYSAKMLQFDAGRILMSFNFSYYKNLADKNRLRKIADENICADCGHFMALYDINGGCSDFLFEYMTSDKVKYGDVFLFREDLSFENNCNGIYIPADDIIIFSYYKPYSKNCLDLNSCYYSTDRRKKQDSCYADDAFHFFLMRYELT